MTAGFMSGLTEAEAAVLRNPESREWEVAFTLPSGVLVFVQARGTEEQMAPVNRAVGDFAKACGAEGLRK
jgi:hypothetical protein